MTDESLTKEIIKRILGNLGVVPPPNFGTLGITESLYKTKEYIEIEYENKEKIKHELWAAETEIKTKKLKTILVDLSLESRYEYLVVFQLDKFPCYGLRLAFVNDDLGLLLVLHGDRWQQVSTLIKAQALVGIEMLTNQGFVWKPLKEFDDLKRGAMGLIDL